MPMRLHILPSIWQSYINVILDCLQSRKSCKAIMSDLLLFTPSKKSHIAKLDLLKALLKNGIKISPKKCQLFRTELQHMENTIFIKDRRVCIKPLRSRLEAIWKLQPPTTAKGCRSFTGMSTFSKHVLFRITRIIKTNMYDVTRKGRQFIGEKSSK